jgi:prolyl oligopeptidase
MKQLRWLPGLFMAAMPMLPAALRAEAPLDYPKTATVDVSDTSFGERVADPYRWLEADVRTDAKVRDWVTAQNKVSNAYLAKLPGRDIFEKRLRELFAFERMGVPQIAGASYFYTRNTGLQNQSTLWVAARDGSIPPRLLVDPNAWAKDGATALAEWAPSDDGRYLAYAVQDGGTDWRTLKIIDVATGKTLDDAVHWVKFSRIAWKRDASGFFYSRFPEPKEGAAFQSLNLNQSVWFHAVGTTQSADLQIYGTPLQPNLNHGAEVSDDGRWLVISSSAGTDPRNAVTLVVLDEASPKPRALITNFENDWAFVGSSGNRMWFRTDKDAPKGRIVRTDVGKARSKPVEIVAQTLDTLVGASMVGSHLIVAYLGDAKSQAERFTLDGKPLRRGRNLLQFFELCHTADDLQLQQRDQPERGVFRAKSRLRSGRLCDRPSFLPVKGRHTDPDVHRPQKRRVEGPGVDVALWLWRVQRLTDSGIFGGAAGVARTGRRAGDRQPSRRRRIWQGLARCRTAGAQAECLR